MALQLSISHVCRHAMAVKLYNYPVRCAQGRVKRLSPLYVYLCVVKKHGCLLSYCSKIATK